MLVEPSRSCILGMRRKTGHSKNPPKIPQIPKSCDVKAGGSGGWLWLLAPVQGFRVPGLFPFHWEMHRDLARQEQSRAQCNKWQIFPQKCISGGTARLEEGQPGSSPLHRDGSCSVMQHPLSNPDNALSPGWVTPEGTSRSHRAPVADASREPGAGQSSCECHRPAMRNGSCGPWGSGQRRGELIPPLLCFPLFSSHSHRDL